MGDRPVGNAADEAASRARVARGALRQIGRHEHAIEACLSELRGRDEPTASQISSVLGRARHHAERARGLAAVAARINRDPNAAAALAAVIERQERVAMRVQRWPEAAVVGSPASPMREED